MPTENALDFDRCYRAVEARDARFDGWFITGVNSTGIYCRPSCPTPVLPMRKNVEFFRSTAAAQRHGLRACKRCRPDASPGSPEWDLRSDTAARAMRLIADGVVDREGVQGLASQLAVSERNLNRILQREVGASPIALARAQRARAARILIETTALPFTEIAFAAGFSSIRQFNDTVRDVFALTPTMLRARGSAGDSTGGGIGLRLAARQPFDAQPIFDWLAAHSPVDTFASADGQVTRTLRLPNGFGTCTVTGRDGHVWCEIQLDDFADLTAAVARIRRLLDLDADPDTISEHFAGTALAPLVNERPWLRVPGCVDGFEQAVMTILGQQVSVAAGRTFGTRLVEHFGTPLASPVDDGPTMVFPSAADLVGADTSVIGITGARQRSIQAIAEAVLSDEVNLTPGADRTQTRAQLLALPGIGPWTADILAMRALGDPDIFPVGDLVLRKAATALDLPDTPRQLAVAAEAWSPWRSYATHHMWAAIWTPPVPKRSKTPNKNAQKKPAKSARSPRKAAS